ncbi:MAG: UDP-N-acetylmuramoyl-L-alanyl-D-glutamate-2,6-diaminopimelate ligase [Candidatus Saccharibacteria bacterium GW2011_GWC2_48_9]|nr:MAG: UDP-N-acetylmuramoyl-L-alanyl-D-glutamate-2,6-diaminopimelate ligase [Candidatus Saccharibacteria bacterium GW2011_GWC2_48_9]HCH34090.1 UDP-N-acetylmuramoyl-L-alanyl-D-glutamate--2,6-diaminopimelate ligase [Candidatus Saccharibacteria bacterium]
MKEKLVRGVRRALPHQSVRKIEEGYRKARVKAVSARYGYPARGLKVIAVTGTNGKTTTINYINAILKAAGHKTAMFSTALIEVDGKSQLNDLNATVGTTARMQQFFRDAKKAKVDYVVLEITSHALHQHKLDGVPIEAAIMTNLTQDHLDYHKTMDAYAEAKAILFKLEPRYIVLNHDDEWFEYYDKFEAGEQKMTYGEHEEAEAHIERVKLYKKGSEADVVFDHQTKLELATHLPGKFNVSNMTAAATISYLLGVSVNDIIGGIADLEKIPGRFERVEIDKAFEVVVDYAHTPDALEKLLETAQSITKNRVILVFGACGDRDKGKRPIMGEIAARLADRIIVTDEESYNEEPQSIRKSIIQGIEDAGASAKMTEIADRREAIAKALSIATKGDMILVTGMGHEQYRIVDGARIPWNDTQVVKDLTI